ncbi:hypothetical protein JXA59_01515 [Patescibacteria group bacterium]|nr:hypothetical protein [Patescibacteria group bacterium]
MKISNTENQFGVVAATFCLIGLALLLSVMIWHQQINQHPWFKQEMAKAAATNLQVAAVSDTADVPTTAVPASVIQEITTDPRNIAGFTKPAEELSPALKFLYTLDSPNLFPAQR